MSETSIRAIDVLELSKNTDNVYRSVVVIGQRANQIGNKLKNELNAKLAEFGPASDALEEIVENREQIEIARFYEGLPKPNLLALNEFLAGKVPFRLKDE